MKNKRKTITNVFLAASAVGAGHFGFSGFENAISSSEVGLAAGFGALAMDIIGTLRTPPTDPEKHEPQPDQPPS